MGGFTRREFIEIAGLGALVLFTPPGFALPKGERVLVLVELSGGNDGLNTVVPFRDPKYAALRPTIGLDPAKVLALDGETGLHPELRGLAASWETGDTAIVRGVGYPAANRSHFRSIEIWETASDSDEYADAGWPVAAMGKKLLSQLAPGALLTVGAEDDGPLLGTPALALQNPEQVVKLARRMPRTTRTTKNPALAHVLETQHELLDAVESMERHLANAAVPTADFGKGQFAEACRDAARIIVSGMGVMVIRLRLGGFDTHVNQPRRHARLMEQLNAGLSGLRRALIDAERWDDTLVVTYSEFGRRVKENGGAGTDHGTAAPQIVMGGAVKGGFHGARPSLDALDANGDLRFTTDFRATYNTIVQGWWGVRDSGLSKFGNVGFL